MKFADAVEDLFRGFRFLTGSAIVLVAVLVAVVFLGSGIVAAIMYESVGIGLVLYFGAIAGGALLVPYLLYRLGKWLR